MGRVSILTSILSVAFIASAHAASGMPSLTASSSSSAGDAQASRASSYFEQFADAFSVLRIIFEQRNRDEKHTICVKSEKERQEADEAQKEAAHKGPEPLYVGF